MPWYKTKPKDKQLEALMKAAGQPAFAYLMEMGTGKSKIMIDEAALLYKKADIDAMLVVCLNGLQQNWVLREVEAHCPVPFSAAYRESGWKKELRLKWQHTLKADGKLKIFALNIEQMTSAEGLAIVVDILKRFKTYLVIDESQRIKSPTAKTTKIFHNIAPQAAVRRIASGTASPQSPMDLWAQYQFLDPLILGQPSYTAFKAEHAVETKVITQTGEIKQATGQRLIPGRDYFMKTVGYRNINKLRAKIAPYTFTCKLIEMEDMPPLTFGEYVVQLTSEQKRIYKELKDEAAASVQQAPANLTSDQRIAWLIMNADVLPQNSLTKMLRMQQVTTGHLKTDDGTIHQLPSNRIRALLDLLESMGDQQALIWCLFRNDINQVVANLTQAGYEAVRYDGATNSEDRTLAVNRFQAGEAKYFIGQPGSGGVGLTLTKATQIIWFSLGFNAAHYMQANARAWRIGQEKHVHVTHMLGQNTLDRYILKALNSKARLMEATIYGNK